ncbi:Kinetochore complex Sim4 subunit Fta1 domain containing protein [Rhypophila decipiens]
MATSSQPRRRGRPAKTTTASPAQSQSQSQSQSQRSISDEGDPNFARPVFYDTSFSAYRVSPLFIGQQNYGQGKQGQEKEEEELLSNKRLGILAQRLRDLLVGDVVRGVEVGLGDDSAGVMGRYGALERVGIRWFSLGRLLDIDHLSADPEEEEEEDGDDENLTTATMWKRRLGELKDTNKRVLQINLEYENSLFMALLLPRLGGEKADGAEEDGGAGFFVGEAGKVQQLKRRQFLDMPLLLLRMPPPLKSVIADFLATSFDCRVSPLRLGTRTMVSCLEAWFRTVGVPSRGPLAKDVVLWLGFHFPKEEGTAHGGDDDEADAQRDGQLGLKTIDVSIPVSDLSRFVAAGRELLDQKEENLKRKSGPLGPWGWERDIRKRRRLAGRLYEEGWEWRAQLGKDKDAAEEEREDYPFTEALGRYVDQHLGLNLFHPGVRVTKIGCGGFFMSEGKLKVFAPSNLGEEGSQAVTASSPGQRGGVLELIWGLMEKATVSPEMFLA